MMSQHVLIETGSVLPIQTLRSLTSAEIDNPGESNWRIQFDNKIEVLYGTHLSPPPNWTKRRQNPGDDKLETDPMWSNDYIAEYLIEIYFVYEDDDKGEEHQMPEVDELEDLDKLIGAEVVLPHNGTDMQSGKVIGRLTDRKGRPIGTYNANPLLDTQVYEVEFPDGLIQQYSANLIAESVHMECDEEGRSHQMMQEIVECRKDADALNIGEEFITTNNGAKSRIKTTKRWKFLVKWFDGQESWVPLKDIKE